MQRADETIAVRDRYARRDGDAHRYSLLNPEALLRAQERQRAIADLLVSVGFRDLSAVRLLEIGCGTGANLLEFLRFGFAPEHLQGIELLTSHVERARRVLPVGVRILHGNAADIDPATIAPESQDIVYQATVFSSLLDAGFEQRLADVMWSCVRPGGGVLWYDFTVNNPRNPDVRGVPVSRIRQLFPGGRFRVRRVTLAPPLARLVVRLHPKLYSPINSCPWLRTHVLAWIGKPE
jgi:SAM-dependent methyltransferase